MFFGDKMNDIKELRKAQILNEQYRRVIKDLRFCLLFTVAGWFFTTLLWVVIFCVIA